MFHWRDILHVTAESPETKLCSVRLQAGCPSCCQTNIMPKQLSIKTSSTLARHSAVRRYEAVITSTNSVVAERIHRRTVVIGVTSVTDADDTCPNKQHTRRILETTDGVITFRVSRRRCEMYCGHARLCVCLCICSRPHAHTIARTRM